MYKLLEEEANELSRDAVKLTSSFVQIPSTSFCEEEVANLVEKTMNLLGYDQVIRDDFGNVLGFIYGSELSPVVLLLSHMDTVAPNEDQQRWQIPPYSGQITGGKLFGVGSSDCKSGLASQIYAGHLLRKVGFPLRGTLIVAGTVSEQNGLSLGTQHLISKTLADMRINVDYSVLGEPTNLGLFYGHDGWVEFQIDIDCPEEHLLNESAKQVFENLLDESQAFRPSEIVQTMDVKAPTINWDKDHSASIIFKRRLFHNDDITSISKELKSFIRNSASIKHVVDVDVQVREDRQELFGGQIVQARYLSNVWETDPFSPLMNHAREAILAVGGKVSTGKWRLPRLGMGTAGGVLTKRFHIPTIGYGPGLEESAHSPDEYVPIDNIAHAVLGSASIVHSLIGVSAFGWTSDMEI